MAFCRLDGYFSDVGGRRLAEGEWGLEIECVGGALEVGVRVVRGLVRAQAWAAPAGSFDAALLLHRNRSLELVRYSCTAAGDVWVLGDLPVADDAPIDRLLGALVDAVAVLREGSMGDEERA
jgi:hypothetical protein